MHLKSRGESEEIFLLQMGLFIFFSYFTFRLDFSHLPLDPPGRELGWYVAAVRDTRQRSGTDQHAAAVFGTLA